jgi:hypothetical protein
MIVDGLLKEVGSRELNRYNNYIILCKQLHRLTDSPSDILWKK